MRIAVCDDNKTELEKIKSCFCRLHEHCTECRYLVSAKDLLSTEMPTQDMYILDIEMPDMNGLELAKKIREKDSRALFLFLTSYTKYMKDVFDVVTFDFLEKPISD